MPTALYSCVLICFAPQIAKYITEITGNYHRYTTMKAVLGLEDGTSVVGEGFGKKGVTCGELVFATPYTGYEEALTDPSYKGQTLLFTYPLIGNYGVNADNFQSAGIKAEAMVVRERCDHPSHNLSKRSLEKFLTDENVSGISDVDTRMLTIKTRQSGTMRSALIVDSDDGAEACRLAQQWQFPKDIIDRVTCKSSYEIKGEGPRIVVMDFGVKRKIIDNLVRRDVHVIVVPAHTSPARVMDYEPDAILLSNGPGDPQDATNGIEVTRKLAGQLPIFGICLGHQIARARAGRPDVQAQVRPPRRQPAGDRHRDQTGLHHQPEPRLRRRPGKHRRHRHHRHPDQR